MGVAKGGAEPAACRRRQRARERRRRSGPPLQTRAARRGGQIATQVAGRLRGSCSPLDETFRAHGPFFPPPASPRVPQLDPPGTSAPHYLLWRAGLPVSWKRRGGRGAADARCYCVIANRGRSQGAAADAAGAPPARPGAGTRGGHQGCKRKGQSARQPVDNGGAAPANPWITGVRRPPARRVGAAVAGCTLETRLERSRSLPLAAEPPGRARRHPAASAWAPLPPGHAGPSEGVRRLELAGLRRIGSPRQ